MTWPSNRLSAEEDHYNVQNRGKASDEETSLDAVLVEAAEASDAETLPPPLEERQPVQPVQVHVVEKVRKLRPPHVLLLPVLQLDAMSM